MVSEPTAGQGTTIGSLALAACIGVVTVFGANGIHSASTERPLEIGQEIFVYALQVIIASSPFTVLALRRVTARTPWLVGCLLTAGVWGYWIYDAVSADAEGANIGLGLLILFSPIPITLAVIGVERVSGASR